MRSESNSLDWDGMEDEDCRISHESESSDSSFGGDDATSNELELNGTADENPVASSNSPQQAIGAELSLSSLVAPPLVQSTQTGRPLSDQKMTTLNANEARSSFEKQAKTSSSELQKTPISGERKEEFSSRARIPQETKLKINSERLNGHDEASLGGSLSGKGCRVGTVNAADKVYLESAEQENKKATSQKRREGLSEGEASTNGELKQMTVKMNGEKTSVKACPVTDIGTSGHVKPIKSGKGFRSESGENQPVAVISGCDAAYISSPAQNKLRRNGEMLVSEVTVNSSCACLPSPNDHSAKLLPQESCKCWRKPLIDQIFITDVTSNFVTVTVKECLTDKGFFRQR